MSVGVTTTVTLRSTTVPERTEVRVSDGSPYRARAETPALAPPTTFTVVAYPSPFRTGETEVLVVTRSILVAWLHVWRYAWRNPYGSANIYPGTCVIDRDRRAIRRVA
jgi:hypothetical protein